MDRPCRSSWTGAHEIFQAEEYDAGASPTHQASQRGGGRQLDKPTRNFENTLGIVAQVFNEAIYEGALVYCNGP
jgi:hypothetical protein